MGGRGERIRGRSGASRRLGAVAVAVGLVLLVGACKPLRDYPAAEAMFFGTAARATALDDPTYASTLAREFGGLVPENELKWEVVHPQAATYDFSLTDRLVNFARDHDMQVRGVPLLWHHQNPAWVDSLTITQARDAYRNHIRTVVGRYRGRITQWDVVNEPFLTSGELAPTKWRSTGRRYMDDAFSVARAADPSAKLFINENGVERSGPKADALFNEVRAMKERGVPIDGVGFQMHTQLVTTNRQMLAEQMARYASIGVEVAITEMDVSLTVPPTPAAFQHQATIYRDMLAACREAPNCNTFFLWGFTDRFSWIPVFFPGYGHATILDGNYGKKPAYDAINDYFANN
jgi:endo-1,4-beta-xylanase